MSHQNGWNPSAGLRTAHRGGYDSGDSLSPVHEGRHGDMFSVLDGMTLLPPGMVAIDPWAPLRFGSPLAPLVIVLSRGLGSGPINSD